MPAGTSDDSAGCRRPRWSTAPWMPGVAGSGRVARSGLARRPHCRADTLAERDLRRRRCRRRPAPTSIRMPRPHLIRAADTVLAGTWTVLGTPRADSADPDWFHDPVTGRRAPDGRLAFRIHHRDEAETGNIKQVWEMSRHHHLTVLAAAWWLTQDERYAEAAAHQLRSWWSANPFLTGVHWTSGIEAGIRLISWTWIRRLLDDWPKVGDLFEHNDDAVRQIAWHQEFLAAFPSRGSSANNHVVAEAAGRLVAACAFPWYARTAQWRRERGRASGARAGRQHVRRRSQSRAGDRLPPLRPRARAGGRRRGRRRTVTPCLSRRGQRLARMLDAGCRHPGCHRPASAAG